MFKQLYYRTYQKVLHLAQYAIDFKEPQLIIKKDGLLDTVDILNKHDFHSVFIVCDPFFINHDHFKTLLELLSKHHISYGIYSKIEPNPTIHVVEDAYSDFYYYGGFESILAVGGGSVMDLAKLVGIKVRYKDHSIREFKGILKVHKKPPLLICAPTTVGTGSEATLAAVVTDSESKEKYAIMDPSIVPKYAILDETLIKDLPKSLIATTAMDALTHAIEAYIGGSTTSKTRRYSKEATKLIFEHLLSAYHGNVESLNALHLASYKAGVSFTRSYVGNVHAIAHQLGGFYNVAHGYANAVILPHILRFYGKKCYKKLAELSYYAGLANKNTSIKDATYLLIEKIEALNEAMGIPTYFKDTIKHEDIATLSTRAMLEANPLYPVPVIMEYDDFYNMYKRLSGGPHE
jgi:alcohol dehydrogenase